MTDVRERKVKLGVCEVLTLGSGKGVLSLVVMVLAIGFREGGVIPGNDGTALWGSGRGNIESSGDGACHWVKEGGVEPSSDGTSHWADRRQ